MQKSQDRCQRLSLGCSESWTHWPRHPANYGHIQTLHHFSAGFLLLNQRHNSANKFIWSDLDNKRDLISFYLLKCKIKSAGTLISWDQEACFAVSRRWPVRVHQHEEGLRTGLRHNIVRQKRRHMPAHSIIWLKWQIINGIDWVCLR